MALTTVLRTNVLHCDCQTLIQQIAHRPLSHCLRMHKSIGECSVCHAVRQLHNSTGTVHRHGPGDYPCPSSDKPSVTVRPPASCQNSIIPAAANRQCDASASASTTGTDSPELTHPTLVRRTIKHIPKSARPACAKRYAELLKLCTDDPSNLHAWEDLLNFGRDVLIQPLRGGKRHSLTSIIKKRTIEAFKADNETVTQSYRAKKQDAATILAKAVSAKIEDRNLKAAIRICAPRTSRRRTPTTPIGTAA